MQFLPAGIYILKIDYNDHMKIINLSRNEKIFCLFQYYVFLLVSDTALDPESVSLIFQKLESCANAVRINDMTVKYVLNGQKL